MYFPKPGNKKDAKKRWNRPDRVFFGFGACHILAGTYLENCPLEGFYGEWIIPKDDFSGHHMFATDGKVTFDYHGYLSREKLLQHYWKGWSARYPGWNAKIERIDFDLLDTVALNKRKHLGPDQFFGDPVARAKTFLSNFDHQRLYAKASGSSGSAAK